MKTIVFQMGYRANQVLTSALIFMYCAGPKYHSVPKSLSKKYRKRLMLLDDQFENVREAYRLQYPELYQKYPLSDDEANRILDFEATPHDLQLLSVALRETLVECNDEWGQKELEIVTTYTLRDLQDAYKVIHETMLEHDIAEFGA